MIRELQINNYKSLHELSLEVGRFNVFIGENGCGKSNLLEAIALAAAVAADKLDNEFLASRGIRVTDPQLMRSAFDDENLKEPIKIGVGYENLNFVVKYTLKNENQPYSKWTRFDAGSSGLPTKWKDIINARNAFEHEIRELKKVGDILPEVKDKYSDKAKQLISEIEVGCLELDDEHKKSFDGLRQRILDIATKYFEYNKKDADNYFEHYENIISNEGDIKNFIIYSPENTALRNFYKEGQIEPLGINGEGLLKLLKVIQSKSLEQRQEIHSSLQLFDWYAELDIPKDLLPSEDKVTITDRYLTIAFDQRSANEGFLFVLFYIALMVSDDTPKIFAIDNIDTSLNPKLCTKLIKELVRLAKKYDKQVFVTTHNPAILDGIDLGDDEQRLFIVSRNKQGHTRFKRIALEGKPRSSTNEELKLSEAFLRGYLGGLPKGF
jgi:AAA15 family ATPase/GTPase